MILSCAYCGPKSAPHWHFCRNYTWKQNDRQNYFIFAGCKHFSAFASTANITFVPDGERAAWEAKWNAEAERLFAIYTGGQGWSDANRAIFRDRLWPKPPPIVPTELFDRTRDEAPVSSERIAEAKAWNDTHPGALDESDHPRL